MLTIRNVNARDPSFILGRIILFARDLSNCEWGIDNSSDSTNIGVNVARRFCFADVDRVRGRGAPAHHFRRVRFAKRVRGNRRGV